MKTILIFGATGNIGTYTAVALRDEYHVIAIGRRASDNGFFTGLGIPYHSIDISRKEDFAVLEKYQPDVVIHLAGAMPAAMKGYNPYQYIDTIVTGTMNVLQYCLTVHCPKIVFSQSHADSKYMMGKTPIPADIEKHFPLTGDHSVYSICKNAAVDLIEHFHFEYGLKRFILRLPTIYAYHPNPFYYVNGQKKWIAYRYIMDRALRGEPLEIWGDPLRVKEAVGIQDLIQIIRNAISVSCEGGMYNVGGCPVTLEEQILGIRDIFCPQDKLSEVRYCPEKPNSPEFVHDIQKTVTELGYKPSNNYRNLLLYFKKQMEENPFAKLWGNPDDYTL